MTLFRILRMSGLLRSKTKTVFIFGDMNVDYLSQEFDLFRPMLQQFSGQQLIRHPTHLGRCIDHIFCGEPGLCEMALIGPNFEKHHHMTYVRLKCCALGGHRRKVLSPGGGMTATTTERGLNF